VLIVVDITGVIAYFPAESSDKYQLIVAAPEIELRVILNLSSKHFVGTLLDEDSLVESAVIVVAA